MKSAKVDLGHKEAVVAFDPSVTKVEDLIKAVKEAHGMASFSASVKKK